MLKVLQTLGKSLENTFGPKPQVEVLETSRHKVYSVNGLPVLAESEGSVFPTLVFTECLSRLPKVFVDMGAVPHVCNGADIMAPGLADVQGDFEEEDLVLVLDERNRKPLAIAQSLTNSETIRTMKKGKAFRTLHYVGDDIWSATKEAY